jgi:hypothetical protein
VHQWFNLHSWDLSAFKPEIVVNVGQKNVQWVFSLRSETPEMIKSVVWIDQVTLETITPWGAVVVQRVARFFPVGRTTF